MDSDALALILGIFGLVSLALACQRLIRGRVIAASGTALLALLLLAAGGLLFVVSLNLHTYARLTHEAPVAELVFELAAPQRYRVTLTGVPSGEMQTLVLAGDEWQLDARVLKWQGWANVLGLDAQYRLERISGRYRNLEQERHDTRTVYDLSENPGIDIWDLRQRYPQWLKFVDAVYGSATYMPMADGARYEVSMTQTGLIARAANEAAQAA
ncbi:MAG TPA: hypothetical protein VJS42_12190, partial [Steroidobacteraceae bacterium]|nr:hypothetical protein [Steroidobacteraceae bacterium]